MASADNLTDISQIFGNLCMVLSSSHQNDHFVEQFSKMQHKISTQHTAQHTGSMSAQEHETDQSCFFS